MYLDWQVCISERIFTSDVIEVWHSIVLCLSHYVYRFWLDTSIKCKAPLKNILLAFSENVKSCHYFPGSLEKFHATKLTVYPL